jgi:hypothetical protein
MASTCAVRPNPAITERAIMTRVDVRPAGEWKAFDRTARIIVLALLILLGLLWLVGLGPQRAGCCAPVTARGAVGAPVDCAALLAGANVEFATDSATLTDAGRAVLDQVLGCLGTGEFEVGGHTDNTGEADTNLKLSLARAEAAKAYLIEHGVAAERLTTHGYGSNQPVASNDDEAGRAKNRRIAFSKR